VVSLEADAKALVLRSRWAAVELVERNRRSVFRQSPVVVPKILPMVCVVAVVPAEPPWRGPSWLFWCWVERAVVEPESLLAAVVPRCCEALAAPAQAEGPAASRPLATE
jgi:hypothetical protein